MAEIDVSLSSASLMPGAVDQRLAAGRDSGARVVFSGQARSEQGRVEALYVEHFPGMTETSLRAICRQAVEKWSVNRILVVHRVGRVGVGEDLVQVGVSADHRREAFLACSFLMDYLKTQAPFWKKEIGPGGEVWVEARASDVAAAARWSGDNPDAEHEH